MLRPWHARLTLSLCVNLSEPLILNLIQHVCIPISQMISLRLITIRHGTLFIRACMVIDIQITPIIIYQQNTLSTTILWGFSVSRMWSQIHC